MGDLTQLRKEFRELASESAIEEEKATYELTASARRFSRRAKHVVDDKLSFSATLMRAGEVEAANRLLEEAEQDVRVEEAALIEKMNEVKIARANKRERITRVRLARLLAVSLAGSMLMGFSALGMAAAGFVQDREQDQIRNAALQRRAGGSDSTVASTASHKAKKLDKNLRKALKLHGVSLAMLSDADVAKLANATRGTVKVAALRSILTSVLSNASDARKVANRIAGTAGAVASTATDAVSETVLAAPKVKKKARKAAETADESEPSPSPEESDPPEETEEDGNQQETGNGDDDKGDEGSGGSGEVPDGVPDGGFFGEDGEL